jgi:hypothetical protein
MDYWLSNLYALFGKKKRVKKINKTLDFLKIKGESRKIGLQNKQGNTESTT